MKRKEIVLIKETRQKEFVKKVMDAAAPHLSLKSSDKVAIKIDLSGSREIYANTHYETVESLIFYLKDQYGITDISVIEGSDGAFHCGKTTWDIFYKFRYKEVELNGARLVNLDDQPHEYKMEVNTISGPKEIQYCKSEADYVIAVVPPKTHNIFPACLTIPNLVGFVRQEDRALVLGASNAEMRKFNFSNTDRFLQLIDCAGQNLAALLKELNPSMALIDGLYGMEGKGPIKGSPVFHGFAIASEDVVLADALTAYIMGFEVDQFSYITYAYMNGLGNNRWQNVIGVDPPQVKFPYRPHTLYQKQKLWKDFFQKKRNPRDKSARSTSRPQKPYKSSKPFNKSGKPPYNPVRDGNRDNNTRDNYRDNDRDNNRDNNRDFNRENNRDYNRDYNRESNRDNSRDNNRDNNRNYNRDYNRDNSRGNNRDNSRDNNRNNNREYNRENNRDNNRDYRSYNKDRNNSNSRPQYQNGNNNQEKN